MRERGGGRSPTPPGGPPLPAPSPRPIPSRRPVCSVMLTLLLFSLSFREKKRRRIEELLAEKLVPPPPTPGLGDSRSGPGGLGGGRPEAGRAASSLTPAPQLRGLAGVGIGMHHPRSRRARRGPDLKVSRKDPCAPSSCIPNCQNHDLMKTVPSKHMRRKKGCFLFYFRKH